MTERYPIPWRNACLELLQARRDELHKSLGFKRMSWAPIRNEVMKALDEAHVIGSDPRLIRQNFESWERGAVLSDEKFALIDQYVRRLAIWGGDVRALKTVQDWRFNHAAGILSSLYMRSSGSKSFPPGVIADLPWVLSSSEVEGAWFKSIIIRGDIAAAGVVRVQTAYLPVSARHLEESHFDDVVFFDGFLVPLEISDGFSSEGEPFSRTICALKLTRPEFRGLSGLGYAEGEIHIIDFVRLGISDAHPFRYSLEFPNPVLTPNISEKWKIRRTVSSKVHKDIGRLNKKGPHLSLEVHRLDMYLNTANLRIIDRLFNLSYKGFVQ